MYIIIDDVSMNIEQIIFVRNFNLTIEYYLTFRIID